MPGVTDDGPRDVTSTEGCRQGDPHGPWLFANAIHDTLCKVQSSYPAGCSWFRLGLLDHLLGHGDERACERKTRIGIKVSGDPLLAHQLSRPSFLGGALCERLGSFVRRVFIFNIVSPTTEPHGAARRL